MEENDLILRCEKLMDEMGVSKAAFCKRVNLSTSAYYAWKSGVLKLSKETMDRISRFIERFGF